MRTSAQTVIALAITAVALAIAAALSAQPNEPKPFRYERPVAGSASKALRLPVDVTLLAGGQPFTVVQRGTRLVAEGGLADLRFVDAQGREVPYLLISPPVEGLASTIGAGEFGYRQSEPGRSRYSIRLPAVRLPIVALRLGAIGDRISRDAYVTEQQVRGHEAVPVELGRATLTRVSGGDEDIADLRIPIARPDQTELDLVIHDGDDPPLKITSVRLELAQLPWIYVETKGAGISARYGNRTSQAPAYDLEAARARIDIRTVRTGTWEAPRDAATVAQPATAALTGAPIETAPFRYSRTIRPGRGELVALALDAAALAHSRGPSGRFEDVRIVDAESRQIPYLVERREEPMPLVLTIEPATPRAPELNPSAPRRSVYRLQLPILPLPEGTLVLTSSAHPFQRTVSVGVEHPPGRQRREHSFETIASGVWRSANGDAAAEELTLRVRGIDAPELLLVVDEGDNSPLPITHARFLLPSYRLRFFRPAGAGLRLLYGRSDLRAPQYDLTLLAPAAMGEEAREIVAAGETIAAPPSGAAAFVSPRIFWGLLGISVFVLVGLVVRLVKQTG